MARCAAVVIALALCSLLPVLATGDAGSPGEPATRRPEGADVACGWEQGRVHTYQVDTKWWLASNSGAGLSDTDVDEGWAPPTGPENHGVRCHVSVQPVAREAWPPASVGGAADEAPGTPTGADFTSGSDGAAAANAWLFRVWVRHCTPLKARFEGEYVPMPRPAQEALDSDVDHRRLATPFFLTRGDDGTVRRLYFFANETLPTRNFKRGAVAFMSFKHPPPEAHAAVARALKGEHVGEAAGGRDAGRRPAAPEVPYLTVDQDENGM